MKNRIQNSVVFLLLLVLLFNTFTRVYTVALFKFNQKEIAATLCEKRFEENTRCKGKCYLNKQLEKQEQQEERSLFKVSYLDEYVCSQNEFVFQNYNKTFSKTILNSRYHYPFNEDVFYLIAAPPKV